MRLGTVISLIILSIVVLSLNVYASSSLNPELIDNFRVYIPLIKDVEKQNGSSFQYGPGDYGRIIQVQQLNRYYEIHVPPSYDKKASFPLVLAFHGGGGDQITMRFVSKMDSTANRKGFIVVYPAGTNKTFPLSNRFLLWNDGRPYQDGSYSTVDDVQYVREVLDDMQLFFKIDTKKIFACGYSNGAQFSYRLAKQLSGRIAAIAAIAGQRPADDFFPPPPRSMAIMHFAGKKDTVCPYDGGDPQYFTPELQTSLKPVTETIKSWVDFNGCSEKPEVKRTGKAVMERYSNCKDNVEVVLWTLEDGGHTWPGGNVVPAAEKLGLGPINQDIFASDIIWEFFERHPLR